VRDTLTLTGALLFSVKQALIRSMDVTTYYTTMSMLSYEGLPSCNVAGLKTKRSCGFVTCPACEVGRRVKFGAHIVRHIAEAQNMYAVHQRVTAGDLHELSSHDAFNSAATWQFFRRLNGLIGTRVSAGFDLDCRSWVFDRIAVVIGERPVIHAPTTARGVVVRGDDEFTTSVQTHRMPDFAGDKAGFVEFAMNLGASPIDIITAVSELGLQEVVDSVLEAQQRWKTQHTRLHLLRLVEPVKPAQAPLSEDSASDREMPA